MISHMPIPQLTLYLVSKGTFVGNEFVLVDVGASGGISPRWRCFGEQLIVYGFEPLLEACEELNASTCQRETYYPFLVGSDNPEDTVPKEIQGNSYNPSVFSRLSAMRYRNERPSFSYSAELYTKQEKATLSAEKTTIDTWATSNSISNIDFIKTDTDGYDLLVLKGGRHALERTVLGLEVECNFHNIHHNNSNSFANIQTMLGKSGFTLFDLSTHRYSRGALPLPFELDLPGQTLGGQLIWGDGLFCRDLSHPEHDSYFKFFTDEFKLLKLACIFELFDLKDCAAELLLVHQEQLSHIIEVESCLNLLTPRINGAAVPFLAYHKLFTERPELFFPNKREHIKAEHWESPLHDSMDFQFSEEERLRIVARAFQNSDCLATEADVLSCISMLEKLVTEIVELSHEHRDFEPKLSALIKGFSYESVQKSVIQSCLETANDKHFFEELQALFTAYQSTCSTPTTNSYRNSKK